MLNLANLQAKPPELQAGVSAARLIRTKAAMWRHKLHIAYWLTFGGVISGISA